MTATVDTEVWRPIPEFPDYEASDLGRIRNRTTGFVYKPLKRAATDTGNGPRVELWSPDGRRVRRSIAVLVAATFGVKTGPKKRPRFKDGDHTNAALSNLADAE